MKNILIAICITLLSISSFAQSLEVKIDNLVKKYSDNRLFNGTVLVADESGVVFKKGYGLANMEWNIANQPDVKFRLGSLTKQFTAMVIMQLVQEGKIQLDKKITDYLDYYRKDVGDKVTIHHLLTHTSGIPSYTGRPNFMQVEARKFYTTENIVKELCSDDFEFQPGTQFAYNNSGYVILGAIIEKVTGKPYAEVLQERIFTPLDMKSTGYDLSETVLSKRAAGYEKVFSEYKNSSFLDMSVPFSAGSLYSTVEDLYKWDRALYSNKLLKKEFKDEYFKPRVEAMGGHYAYGWAIYKNKTFVDGKELTLTVHGGGINGFNTLLTRVVDDKKLVVLLNNTGTTVLNAISNSILNILYNKEPGIFKAPVSIHIGDVINEKGIDEGIKEYKRIQAEEPDKYIIRETELNELGYYYLTNKKFDEAIAVFKLNSETFPQSFNVYDSMGEALMKKGNKDEAIRNYKKSLELNPRNTNAVDMLKKLGVEAEVSKDAVVSPTILKTYVGKYELDKNFIFTITEENGKLYVQATGQPRTEIFPESETKFYAKVVNAQFVFQKDDKGNVTGLTLFQNGQELFSKKLNE
ncbi:MAG: serine hydrolase [Syntrophothermus sp.]